jgi:hypothetical protein
VSQAKPKNPAPTRRHVPGVSAQSAPVDKSPTAQAEPKPRAISLDSHRLKDIEFQRLVMGCYPPKEHTIEDMKRPEYWAAVAGKLRPWNHIEVYSEDGTWYAELLVLAVERAHAVVHVLAYHSLSTSDVVMTSLAGSSKYEIRHTPGLQWHIIRRADRHIVRDQMARREDAEFALTEHLKTVPA